MTELKKYMEELMDFGRSCTIRFRGSNEALTTMRAKIKDLYRRDHVDYVMLETGLEIKEDRIIEIDGRNFQPLA